MLNVNAVTRKLLLSLLLLASLSTARAQQSANPFDNYIKYQRYLNEQEMHRAEIEHKRIQMQRDSAVQYRPRVYINGQPRNNGLKCTGNPYAEMYGCQ